MKMLRNVIYLLTLFSCFIFSFSQAQTAQFHIIDKANKEGKGVLLPLGVNPFLEPLRHSMKENAFKLSDGQLHRTFALNSIEPFMLIYGQSTKFIYLSPGDGITLEILRINEKDSILVTGKGSENNQYLPISPSYWSGQDFTEEKNPEPVLQKIDSIYERDANLWKVYQQKHKPTKAMKIMMENHLAYTKASLFYRFWGNHKYNIGRMEDSENIAKNWINKRDSLLALQPLSNPEALGSFQYRELLAYFILRHKEELWGNPSDTNMYKTYYPELTIDEAKMEYNTDSENLLKERIINKYFSGKVNEYAYAHLLMDIKENKQTSSALIIDRFEKKYPNNQYLNIFAPFITQVKENDNRQFNDKMVFVKDGEKFTSFDQVLSAYKGKTVLIDMWGTWCAPCHQEIVKNSGPLKKHFLGKDVTFLYIANYDTGKDEQLKKLIAYYNLEGQHINALEGLTKDIMRKTGANGFPSYIVIKKDGTFSLSKAGYPMNRDTLIKEIEASL